jgi:hypothetical protein
MIETIDAFLAAFGGPKAVAKVFGVGQSAVANWRAKGMLPARLHGRALRLAAERGLELSDRLFFAANAGRMADAPFTASLAKTAKYSALAEELAAYSSQSVEDAVADAVKEKLEQERKQTETEFMKWLAKHRATVHEKYDTRPITDEEWEWAGGDGL